MENAKNDRLFAALAAVGAGIALLCRIGMVVQRLSRYLINGEYAMQGTWFILQAVQAVLLIALVITLLCRSRVGVMIVAVQLTLLHVYNLLRFLTVSELLLFLACAVWIGLLILSLAKVRAVRFLWFLPALLYLIGTVLYWITYRQLLYFFRDPGWGLYYLLLIIAQLAAFFGLLFAGLWIRDATPEKTPVRGTIADRYAGVSRISAPAYVTDAGAEPYHPAGSSKNYAHAAAARFCGSCGSQNSPGMRFCQFCGAPLRPRP